MLKVKSMAFNELVKAKAKIEAELELRAAKERSRLIDAIGRLRRLSATKSNGVGAGRPHALKGKKLPPLYRNPKNRAETWAGRGNRPRWLVAALRDAGGEPATYVVTNAGHSAMERENALALTAIMDGLPPLR